MTTPGGLVRSALARLAGPLSPYESQQGARRNALLASTALVQQRLERIEVEEFLAAHGAGPPTAPVPAASHGSPAAPEARRDVI